MVPKSDALIVFARRPALHRVKTRLAADIGDEAALRAYHFLLRHTYLAAFSIGCDRFLYLTGEGDNLSWPGFTVMEQSGGDLGARMQQAFAEIFDRGYARVVIIGSDCPDLTSAIVSEAFEALPGVDVVLGPALDGGYYLLGMIKPFPEVFQNKAWSTSSVLEQTIADVQSDGRSYSLLRPLRDVDRADDLPAGWL